MLVDAHPGLPIAVDVNKLSGLDTVFLCRRPNGPLEPHRQGQTVRLSPMNSAPRTAPPAAPAHQGPPKTTAMAVLSTARISVGSGAQIGARAPGAFLHRCCFLRQTVVPSQHRADQYHARPDLGGPSIRAGRGSRRAGRRDKGASVGVRALAVPAGRPVSALRQVDHAVADHVVAPPAGSVCGGGEPVDDLGRGTAGNFAPHAVLPHQGVSPPRTREPMIGLNLSSSVEALMTCPGSTSHDVRPGAEIHPRSVQRRRLYPAVPKLSVADTAST